MFSAGDRGRRRRRRGRRAPATRPRSSPRRGAGRPTSRSRPTCCPRRGDRAGAAGRRAEPPAPGAADDAYPLIDAAERILIWAGAGARDRADEVVALAERLTAPVLTTFGARGVIPPEHPCCVGMPPHVEPAGRLWDDADLVIAFGSDLDGMNTQNWLQPQPPHIVAVNLDAADASKNYAVDVVVRRARPEPSAAARRRRRRRLPRGPRRGLPRPRRPRPALPGRDLLRASPTRRTSSATCASRATGSPGFHGFHAPRKLQYPMGWGTLGFAFPAALGASLAGTGPTVSISGDGGFLFACGELATMAQEQLPFTAVIVDDGGYGMLRYDQQLAGEATYGVDLATPDFAALAESLRRAARRRSRGSTTRSASRSPSTSPAAARACWWRRRRRSCRRRRPRRTGTASAARARRRSARPSRARPRRARTPPRPGAPTAARTARGRRPRPRAAAARRGPPAAP